MDEQCYLCQDNGEFAVTIEIPGHPKSQLACRAHLGYCAGSAADLLRDTGMPYGFTVKLREGSQR